ncbi:DNA polymerase I [Candidatus Saganbacteria bacterium CG08_land_8_20_14_0_20_45_16]|uniref:DNA polymerase I n=1 Tax=Candidatus Saganbacteria bacterium CG08_land_8_20_14_0_20_45_16 TaxID=2014293 RepID=A0A2H0XT77_UNCSA|nr:MAG: DNA polymerase I [Candidatus Saganbacteria bacterium CG08_land_8_20_14_0_20_45_16]
MNKNSKIILIDGNSLAYRAFYALPDTMKTTTGITTNAVYGSTMMLLKVLDEKPDFVAIAFDRREPTFRHKEYKEYKATRQKAPPTLYEQMPYVREVAESLDIPVFELAGYEADDLIGTLTKEAESAGHEVEILTGDLDALQLVSPKTKVLTTRKGITDTVLYGEKEVEERFGIKPNQIIDFKALKGDTSDNIPGVPKVGEKTAVELLKEYGTLEEILKNIDNIKKKALKENLANNIDLAKLSQKLATIVTNAPIEIDFDKCQRGEINWSKVVPLFEKFEFNSLVKKHSQGLAEYSTEAIIEKKRDELAKFNFQCVKDDQELSELIHQLEKAEVFAFDLETTSLNPFEAEIVGISFAIETMAAFYVPMKPTILEQIKPLLQTEKLKIGHNIKYDIEVLKQNGVEVAGPFFDTMVAAYLLNPVSGKLALKVLAQQFLGRQMIKMVELIGKEAEYKNFSEVPLDIATDYACSDAEATFGLYEIFKLALEKQKLDKLFHEVEMPLIAVLVEMESNGVKVDEKLLAQMAKEIDKSLKDLEEDIYAIAGEVFNINSPKQLSKILFEKLMLPVLKKTKTGASTNFEVLEELAAKKFEIAEKLIDYRQLSKLKSTYVDVLPTLAERKTGRIHTSFNQTITATGRLSSSDPNLQNIPARGEWGKRLRSAFVPEKKDWVIMAADYSQIELRILAHLSADPALKQAFLDDKDIHQATADELGITRNEAKAVNFGIIYGISDFGLAKQLKIKRTEAAEFIAKYFNKYRGVKAFMDRTIAEAKENGFVTTMLGRKRPLPDINSPNHGIKSFAERTAINTPVQGTAADMIKIAMVKIFSHLTAHSSKLILQVHDELVLECPKSEVETTKQIIEAEMVAALELSVPVKIEVGIGASWAGAKA